MEVDPQTVEISGVIFPLDLDQRLISSIKDVEEKQSGDNDNDSDKDEEKDESEQESYADIYIDEKSFMQDLKHLECLANQDPDDPFGGEKQDIRAVTASLPFALRQDLDLEHITAALDEEKKQMKRNMIKLTKSAIDSFPAHNIPEFTQRQTFADSLQTLTNSASNIWSFSNLKRCIRKTTRDNHATIITKLVNKMQTSSSSNDNNDPTMTTSPQQQSSQLQEDIDGSMLVPLEEFDSGEYDGDDDKPSYEQYIPAKVNRPLESVITMISLSPKIKNTVTMDDVKKAVYASTTVSDGACQLAASIINLYRRYLPKRQGNARDPDASVFSLAPFFLLSKRILESVGLEKQIQSVAPSSRDKTSLHLSAQALYHIFRDTYEMDDSDESVIKDKMLAGRDQQAVLSNFFNMNRIYRILREHHLYAELSMEYVNRYQIRWLNYRIVKI
ncbi:hypothetical protein BDA99DRAFT_540282 [Phascolomyces articulosus]|uniref:Uncharacterized protein n=1 Tax=Phascolomyces articulosus TaxID=60185 RepID=A0AAD5PBA1_9FUNG|nr:hypothetical protein BDA99DRAFT_540282 [Phascolomyces articulosus]